MELHDPDDRESNTAWRMLSEARALAVSSTWATDPLEKDACARRTDQLLGALQLPDYYPPVVPWAPFAAYRDRTLAVQPA
jgi:hypothetical protein